ncbi:DUF1653 domain-containing protein [Candidatus Parcubacteria bacterium]|nr:DUF1653 domain-containing protein [Candidatus Parcubacteria bacterium]
MGHVSEEELTKRLGAGAHLRPGDRYVHYRMPDQPYEIVSVGLLESNEEPAVVYKALYGKGLIWIRTLSNFLEPVEHEGNKVPRFRKLG